MTRSPSRTNSRTNSRMPRHPSRPGFTITELLIVIGIIILLIGILLPALGKVNERAKVAETNATMEEFAKACEAFRQEFGFYPGIVPEEILAADPQISGTENAILHLMGGAIDQNDPEFDQGPYVTWPQITFGSGPNTFRIRYNVSEIGKGPRIAGQSYAPFFSPKSTELAPTTGQVLADGTADDKAIPDLLDAWGQPIMYLRAARGVGDLVGEYASGARNQFVIEPIYPYLLSDFLGELGQAQADSILRLNSGSNRAKTLAQLIRHPGFGNENQPNSGGAIGTAKGKIVLMSSGADGIYFSQYDGPGTEAAPQTNIRTGSYAKPGVVGDYDDVAVFTGG